MSVLAQIEGKGVWAMIAQCYGRPHCHINIVDFQNTQFLIDPTDLANK